MAENITLGTVDSFANDSSAVAIVNANSQLIENAFQDVISRTGGAPNAMGAVLDMNNNQIINLPSPATINSPVRLIDVINPGVALTVPPVGTSGATVPLLNGINTWSAPQTSTLTTGAANFNWLINRTVTGTGTANSQFGTDTALGVFVTTSPTQTVFEYASCTQIVNLTPYTSHSVAQHVAVAGTTYKGTLLSGTDMSDSWAGFFQMLDITGKNNPTGLMRGVEIDIGTASGTGTTDTNASRIGLQILGRSDGAIGLSHVNCGIQINSGQAVFDSACLLAGTFQVGFNFINGTYSTGELLGTSWSVKNGSATFLNLILNPPGVSSSVFIGANSSSPTYNILSLNGVGTSAANIGLTAGASGDKNLYIQTPSTGNVSFQNNGAVVATVGSAGGLVLLNTQAIGTGSAPNQVFSYSSTANLGYYSGTGAPTFSAAQGAVYIRTDGGASTRMYINNNGSTGWAAVTSA